MSQKCRFCGTALEGYETFCPGCGRELTPDSGSGFRPAPDAFGEIRTSDAKEKAARTHPANAPVDLFMEQPARRPEPRRSPANRSPANRHPANRRTASGKRSPSKRRVNSHSRMSQTQRMALLGALAVAAVVLIALSVRLIRGGSSSGSSYDFSGVLNTYFESVQSADPDKFISTRPPAYVSYLTTGTGGAYPTEAVYRNETASTLQARLENYEAEYGDVRAIRYYLDDIASYTHRCEALSDVLTAWYGFPAHSVQDAVIINGTYTVQGTKATGEFAIADLLLIQIDGTWYFSPNAGSYWKAE